MNDLVRRSEVLDLLYKIFEKYNMSTDKTSDLRSFGTDLFKEIKEMPTAYDIDKVVDELDCDRCESCSFLEVCAGSKCCTECHKKIIEIVKQGIVSDDVCEWESDYKFVSDKYKRVTSCGYEFYDLHHAVPFEYCPYCGKKIKVVE